MDFMMKPQSHKAAVNILSAHVVALAGVIDGVVYFWNAYDFRKFHALHHPTQSRGRQSHTDARECGDSSTGGPPSSFDECTPLPRPRASSQQQQPQQPAAPPLPTAPQPTGGGGVERSCWEHCWDSGGNLTSDGERLTGSLQFALDEPTPRESTRGDGVQERAHASLVGDFCALHRRPGTSEALSFSSESSSPAWLASPLLQGPGKADGIIDERYDDDNA